MQICYAGRCELQAHCPLRFTPPADRLTREPRFLRRDHSNLRGVCSAKSQREARVFAPLRAGCEGKAAGVLCRRGTGYVSL